MAALTIVGLAFRIAVDGQSLVGDELSTLWIVTHNGFSGVVSIVSSDAEITPPLYFILAELASKLGTSSDLIRLPAMIAGTLMIPLTYLLGRELVSLRAGLVAAGVSALSPFLIYFSADARAYAVMLLLLGGSTLFMLLGSRTGQVRWWIGYGICVCLVMYSHYTGIFVLAAQFLWAMWALPGSRKPMLVASGLAALAFMPWVPSWIDDLKSPTTDIMSSLQGTDLHSRRVAVEQLFIWRTGTDSIDYTSRIDVMLLLAGLLVAVVGVVVRRVKKLPLIFTDSGVNHGVVLILILVLATPVGTLLLGLGGTNVFGARNMAASWVGIPLLFGMVIAVNDRVTALVATVLVLAGYTIGAFRLADASESGFAYRDAAAYIDGHAAPGDAVVDSGYLTPAPETPLDAYLPQTRDEYRLGLPEDTPAFINTIFTPPDPQPMIDEAFSGDRDVWLSTLGGPVTLGPDGTVTYLADRTISIPKGWEIKSSRTWDGLVPMTVTEFSPVP